MNEIWIYHLDLKLFIVNWSSISGKVRKTGEESYNSNTKRILLTDYLEKINNTHAISFLSFKPTRQNKIWKYTRFTKNKTFFHQGNYVFAQVFWQWISLKNSSNNCLSTRFSSLRLLFVQKFEAIVGVIQYYPERLRTYYQICKKCWRIIRINAFSKYLTIL